MKDNHPEEHQNKHRYSDRKYFYFIIWILFVKKAMILNCNTQIFKMHLLIIHLHYELIFRKHQKQYLIFRFI